MKATLLYTLARLGVFVALFLVLRLLPLSVYLAAAIAAILAFLISYIFFGRLRLGVAESIVRRRAAPERDEDADLEDSMLDGPTAPGNAGASGAGTGTGSAGVSIAKSRPSSSSRQAPPAEDD